MGPLLVRFGSPERVSRLLSSLGPLVGLGFVVALFAVALDEQVRPLFFSGANLKIILTQTVIYAVGALGMTLIIVSGGIDLSVGSVVALASVVAARLVLGMAAPEIASDRIRGAAGFLERLESGTDPVSRFVSGQLSEVSRGELGARRTTEVEVGRALDVVVRDLNVLIGGPNMYDAERFNGVALGAETRRLLAQETRSAGTVARLNRRLLEDAYPEALPRLPGWGFVVAVVGAVTVATGGLVGLVNGATVAALRLMPFIVTLGMMGIVRGVAKWMGNNQTVNPPDNPVNALMGLSFPRQLLPLPPGVWVAAGLALIMAVVLRWTVFGRYIFAIGSNESTARLCGIRVSLHKVFIYSLAGLFFGFAGLLQFSRLTQGDPSVAVGLELDIIAAVVIGGASLSGGTGSIFGSVIGALMMVVLRSGSNQMGWPNYMQEIIIGVVIVLAVGLDKWRQARAARQTG